jgi:predicted DNA-binding transcriptional regulator AlpA
MSVAQDPVPQKAVGSSSLVVLTPNEAAERLKVSLSWLAKARMRGDGPGFIKIGRAIRYSEAALLQWMKSRQRLSTSEQ